MYTKFSDLVGKVIKEVEENATSIVFKTVCGKTYMMSHLQDCCEHVYIDDINGDLKLLVGQQILSATEDTGDWDEHDGRDKDNEGSYTYTFYNIRTMLDTITIRWYGTSNGYYSETADFYEIE